MKLLRPPKVPKHKDFEVLARARPEECEAIETYYYEKNISRSPYLRSSKTPIGRIEIQVPLDGYGSFPRQAHDDIKHQIGLKGSAVGQQARIGFLALTGFGRTDLKSGLNLSDRCGAVPLSIPLASDGIDSLEQLVDDHHTCVIAFDYNPGSPEVVPVNIDVSLWDEESLSRSGSDLLVESGGQNSGSLTVKIKTQENFLRSMLLQMTAWISLPREFLPEDVTPIIRKMSLRWPTLTSLRGLHLYIGERSSANEVPIRYDPITRCLEWFHVPLTMVPIAEGTACQSFRSQPMQLLIDYPGELFSQAHLDGTMDIEVPGRLLSGLKMSLIDGLGRRPRTFDPKLTTNLRLDYRLVLSDSFARRTLSPYQHLHFQEVVPDEMRLADVKNALIDRGFKILQEVSLQGEREIQHILWAERAEAPDPLRLVVLVDGIRKETERQTQVLSGQTFKSKVQSGDLRIYIRGELRGKSQRLIQEMIAFQDALRPLFPPHDPS